MSLEKDFLDMMPHIIKYTRVLGYDRNVEPIVDPSGPREYQARVTGKFLSLRRPASQDETPIFDIYVGARIKEGRPIALGTEDTFTVDGVLELPDDPAWVDGTPQIFAVGRITDDHGHHHVKIQCGWMYHRQGQ